MKLTNAISLFILMSLRITWSDLLIAKRQEKKVWWWRLDFKHKARHNVSNKAFRYQRLLHCRLYDCGAVPCWVPVYQWILITSRADKLVFCLSRQSLPLRGGWGSSYLPLLASPCSCCADSGLADLYSWYLPLPDVFFFWQTLPLLSSFERAVIKER